MKMPVAMKDKWVAALRSGKYKQSQGKLKHLGGHCCLGVLQEEISGDVEYVDESWVAAPVFTTKWCEANGVFLDLPERTEYCCPSVMSDNDVAKLVELNDGPDYQEEADPEDAAVNAEYIKSFSIIADWIEKNVEVY